MAEPRRERKVVTVLFADLVGFTSRVEQLDPEDVEAMVRPYHERLRRELERHGGTVEKFIGDAVMAVFGAPVAHEDDPERGVRAALAIRDWAREEDAVQVRIAVNTGEALINFGARSEAGEWMVAGDVVNTTARMQSAAPVNGVVVSDATRRATRDSIDYLEREPVAAKGKAEPVPVWEAVQARAAFGVDVRQVGSAVLVGREHELETLVAALDRAERGRVPQLVTLVGVPGIGKSRLVFELFQRVEAATELVYWRQGRSLPYGEGASFWALGALVKAHAGILENDDDAASAAKLHDVVGFALHDPSEAKWVEEHLRRLIGLAGGDARTGDDDQSESFAAWRRFFEALAEEGPVVLVFEDIQWADDSLLAFVDHLVEWAADVPLLVVVTARPEFLARRPDWGGGKPNALTVSLSPLNEAQTTRLIQALLEQRVLSADVETALLERTAGNPLYAEEFVRLVADQLSGEELSLPESVQGIIAARLDGVPAEEKRVLQDAAVVGKVFWPAAVAAIAGGDAVALDERLHQVVRKEFVRRERRSSIAGEAEFAFRHALVRDVAYGQIPRAERADKHRRAAEWIESLGRSEDHAELLAHHYVSAVELSRLAGAATGQLVVRARRALREAGDRAVALYAYAAAARHYERATEIAADPDPDRPRALLRHGQALQALGDERRFELLEEAHDALLAAGDEEGAVEADLTLVESWYWRSDHERCVEHLDRAAALVRKREPTVVKARATAELARFRMMFGHFEEALRFAQEGLELAKATGLPELEARNLITIGTVRSHDNILGGLEELKRGIEIAREAGAIGDLARGLNNLAYWYERVADLRRTEELAAESLALRERLGQVEHIRSIHGNMLQFSFASGRWDETERFATKFLAESEAGSPHLLDAFALGFRSRIRLGRDEGDAALEDASRALDAARRSRDPDHVAGALQTKAFVQSELGATEEAAVLLDELLPHGIQYYGWPEVVLVAERVGRTAEIRAIVDGLPDEIRWKIAARATLDGRHADAADVYGQIGTLPDEAYERLRAARTLAGAGRREEAMDQLRRSLAFFRSVGATRYIREGEELLAASAA
jgi:class 3 adenylate cyclase